MSKLVCVTGGHGFIGSSVVKRLRARGWRVRCMLRPTSKAHRIAALDVERVVGDVLDLPSLRAAFVDVDAVIHLAGMSAYKDLHAPHAWPTIVDGTRNVLDAARDAGVGRVVTTSSGVVFGSVVDRGICDERSPFVLGGSGLIYAEAKHASEQVVADAVAAGLDAVITLPMETYGPDDDDLLTSGYLKAAINDWPVLATKGATSVGHVDDVAEGILLALERGVRGERYILGGDALSIRGIIDLALEISGHSKRALVLPTTLTKAVVNTLFRLGLPSLEHPNAVAYGTLYSTTTSAKAVAALGYAPRPARDVLTSTVRWLEAAGHVKAKPP